MADADKTHQPSMPNGHHMNADKYGTMLVNKAEEYHEKFSNATPGDKSEKKPAGGYDDTAIPKAPPGYTIRITFHRAENLPIADLPSFSSDPYIMAIVQTDLQKRHKQDPDLTLRTPTVHRSTNPEWNATWTIAHIPSSGFHMKCRLYDEDPSDHDDRLGNVNVDVDRIDDSWKGFKERKFEVKKRRGSKRAYTIRGCTSLFSGSFDSLGGDVYISVENLGRSEGNGGRAYTTGPLPWIHHYSPLIGMIAGTKSERHGKDGKKSTEKYNFQAIQMQLAGPVPEHLYHRYVEFRPFVAGMFTSHSLRGRILNHALHHQHARVYNFDGSTEYGTFESPSIEMSKKFLEFVHYDKGGRIFTYVITLDGQLRFTETGKEFGIDLLSKHTMHSDVSIYIAFSGEFFVRRLKHPHKDKNDPSPDPEKEAMPPATEQPDEKERQKEREKGKEGPSEDVKAAPEHHDTLSPPADHHESGRDLGSASRPNHEQRSRSSWRHRSHSATSSARSPAPHAEQTNANDEPSKDPSFYELIIDNDSGTYRPNAKYLGQLKKFLQHSFPGLRIATLDSQGDEEKMKKLKGEQRERKKNSGQQVMYMQNSSMSSISSSDEEELERRADEAEGGRGGIISSKIQKVKNLAKGDQDEKDNSESENVNLPSSSTEKKPVRQSTSTGEKASFDTATEHGDGHFVTPKPSLGGGGLNQFDQDDRPLPRGIDDELERRGMGKLSQEKLDQYPETKTTNHAKNAASLSSVHRSVTSGA